MLRGVLHAAHVDVFWGASAFGMLMMTVDSIVGTIISFVVHPGIYNREVEKEGEIFAPAGGCCIPNYCPNPEECVCKKEMNFERGRWGCLNEGRG